MPRWIAGALLAVLSIPLWVGPAPAGWEGKFADDSNCVAVNPRIVLDGVMYPHISHYDVSNQSLKYIFYDGGHWNSILIDPGHSRDVSGLVHDANGLIHLAYTRDDGLGYGVKAGNTWNWGQIVSNLNAGESSTSLAVEPQGTPHLAYAANLDGGVMYLTYVGAQLVAESLNMAGTNVAVGVDSLGNPVIAFLTIPKAGQTYGHPVCARKVAGDWIIDSVDTGVQAYGAIDLTVDSGDRIHIVYRNWQDGELRHAMFDGSAWGLQVASANAGMAGIQRIDTDSKGNPHIVFSTLAGKSSVLRYANRDADGASWLNEDITTGIDADIAVDPLGRPHAAHGQLAGDRVPEPWPTDTCSVLKYTIRR
jgi:hypothetical protein